MNEKHKAWSKKQKILIIGGSVLGFLLLLCAGLLVFVSSNLSQFKDVEPDYTGELTEEAQDTSLDPNLPDLAEDELQNVKTPEMQSSLPEGIYHVMLYGLDTRDKDRFTGSRTDVMLLITMDTRSDSVKLTSFMRDILVPIPEHGYNRLNAAYVFGGPALTTQVIARQFGLPVKNYVVMNFWSTASIIDLFNGIDINIKKNEVEQININISEMNGLDRTQKTNLIKNSGQQHLTGVQAVAYMRIRHVGTDFERTQRQRTVLQTLLKSLSSMSLDKVLQLLQVLPQYIRTNLSQTEMLSFAQTAYDLRNAPIKEMRIPVDGSYKDATYKKMWVFHVDFEKNAEELKKFIQIEK